MSEHILWILDFGFWILDWATTEGLPLRLFIGLGNHGGIAPTVVFSKKFAPHAGFAANLIQSVKKDDFFRYNP